MKIRMLISDLLLERFWQKVNYSDEVENLETTFNEYLYSFTKDMFK